VQNAVEYRFLGVATAGSTLFRQIGGSIGVSIFGAIFANRLGVELASHLPAGVHVPTVANPAVLRRLPPDVHAPYVTAFAAALRPVFLAAAGVGFVAFLFTWLLRELPLRKTAQAEGIGESFASPREESSERELERIVSSLLQQPERERVYGELVRRSGLDVDPAEGWVLGRVAEHGPITARALAADLGLPDGRLDEPVEALRRHEYLEANGDLLALSEQGRAAREQLAVAGREQLCILLEGWRPEEDEDLAPVLRRLARALVAEMPLAPGRDGVREDSPEPAQLDPHQ
jgi:DNA-binding MarR family transcriptional regulator